MRTIAWRVASSVFFVACAALAQQPITIHVDASHIEGAFRPVWNYFGYDEANYTYAANGRKLIRELAELSKTPPIIRTHFLLATGNGVPALKWGSTNAYTEDPSGDPVYDWSTIDRIFMTYLEAGARPLVEIGFMPKALSTNPEPYQPSWAPRLKNEQYALGWSYPPKDYAKWSGLIYQWIEHSIEKYGRPEVESWQWEVWNEPDIFYWHGSPEEYDKLYDYTADAAKRALPTIKIGGPASTSPRNAKAAAFLRQFLEHCSSGTNYATGKTGAPLNFISYHAKGQPAIVNEQVTMGLREELRDVSAGFEVIKSFEKFRRLPIIFTEADPEGCAACSAQIYQPNAYRNGALYPAYVATALKSILQLADKYQVNVDGILTWAFEFEGQPYFAGFRSLATNGIDKPVLNIFRMLGLMTGDRIRADSGGAYPLDSILQSGVRNQADIDALAFKSAHTISIAIWNYRDEDVTEPPVSTRMIVAGIPAHTSRVLLHHYRIDQNHSNAFTAWKQMGAPQTPSPEEYSQLQSAGQLQLLESPRWVNAQEGSTEVQFSLPSQAISLIQIDW